MPDDVFKHLVRASAVGRGKSRMDLDRGPGASNLRTSTWGSHSELRMLVLMRSAEDASAATIVTDLRCARPRQQYIARDLLDVFQVSEYLCELQPPRSSPPKAFQRRALHPHI